MRLVDTRDPSAEVTVTDYETETRHAYQDAVRASAYKEQHQGTGFRWARLTSHRELRSVRRGIRRFGVRDGDRVLDAPCGTGVAGRVLSASGALVFPSDISAEMMSLAAAEYEPGRVVGFTRSDLAALPFADNSFAGAVVLGLMHRLPPMLKRECLLEVARVTTRFAIVSFTVDTTAQRIKRTLLRAVRPNHRFAPEPMSPGAIQRLCDAAGFRVVRAEVVVPLLSGEVVFWLERTGTAA